MPQKFTDGAKAGLTLSINAAATSLTITGSLADLFPVVNTSNWVTPVNWFKALIVDDTGAIEVIKVGTRASGSGTLSNILRAQDGTTAKSFTAGNAWVVHGPVASDFEAVLAGIFADLAADTLNLSGDYKQAGAVVRPVPIGGIIMWSGAVAAVPAGWALCNGSNGTPDLRDKFVVGAGTDLASVAQTNITGAQTKTGGSKDAIAVSHTHALTAATAASGGAHTHTASDAGHTHTGGNTGLASFGDGGNIYGIGANNVQPTGVGFASITVASGGAHTHALSGNTDAAGSSGTDANLPPYYALAFIMCLGAA